jgi:hypothetical protein
MKPSKNAGRPSLLALNPRNREASASRRTLLLAAFNALPEDDRADLLEAAETLASRVSPGLGLDEERDEARRVIHLVYAAAGWDDGRPRA